MVFRWEVYDPILNSTTTLPLNPVEGGTPAVKKGITRRGTTAPAAQGRTIIFEGLDEPQDFKVSGTILTQAHFEYLEELVAKRHQVQITDDLGRVFWVYFTEFSPTRIRRRSFPWAHRYDMSGTILDVPA
jgi:hypothetical protein